MSIQSEQVNKHNAPTAIGLHNGTFDYPCSRGLGVDLIDYTRRNPHPTERTPLPVRLKMRDLPHSIIRDLKDASRSGELREELHRHIDLLEQNQYADKGTISLLRGYESDMTGHRDCDADSFLDTLTAVVGSCGPREV
jgi:hypothetical protein